MVQTFTFFADGRRKFRGSYFRDGWQAIRESLHQRKFPAIRYFVPCFNFRLSTTSWTFASVSTLLRFCVFVVWLGSPSDLSDLRLDLHAFPPIRPSHHRVVLLDIHSCKSSVRTLVIPIKVTRLVQVCLFEVTRRCNQSGVDIPKSKFLYILLPLVWCLHYLSYWWLHNAEEN